MLTFSAIEIDWGVVQASRLLLKLGMIMCKLLRTYNVLKITFEKILQPLESTEVICKNSLFDALKAILVQNRVRKCKNDHLPTFSAIEIDWGVISASRLLLKLGMIMWKLLRTYNVLKISFEKILQPLGSTEVTQKAPFFDVLRAIFA